MKLPRFSPRAAAIATNAHPCHFCEELALSEAEWAGIQNVGWGLPHLHFLRASQR